MNAQQNFSTIVGGIDKRSFVLGYATTWIDPDRFSKELGLDPSFAVKSWLKGFAEIRSSLQFFGVDGNTYEELLPFVPEEELTEIMKLELHVLEEEAREGGKPEKQQKALTKKLMSIGKVIKTLLDDKAEELMKSLLIVEFEGVGRTVEVIVTMSGQAATTDASAVGEPTETVVQQLEPDPKKEEPSVPKKSKEQEELDRLAFLWITGQYY